MSEEQFIEKLADLFTAFGTDYIGLKYALSRGYAIEYIEKALDVLKKREGK